MISKYPYPFKAALAFSNDADFLTLESMLSLHRYLSQKPENGGVGIDCSDSFFFFQSRPVFPCYSYFRGTTLEEEPHAGLLRELIRTGYLDTTHALGDFEGGNYTRHLAKGVLGNLDRHGLKINIWTNHGGFGNIQNIADRSSFYHQQGDDINSPYYVLDIVEEIGVRYFAICTSYTSNMSLQPIGDIASEKDRKSRKSQWRLPRIIVKEGFSCKPQYWNDRKHVFHKIETRSGAVLQGFNRYNCFLKGGEFPVPENVQLRDGRCPGPNLGRLSQQVSKDRLDSLIRNEASCFLYQHFSTIRHLPERTHITSALEMHNDNIDALKLLGNYYRRGDIWVASQRTLLDYLYMVNTIEIYHRRDGDILHVDVRLKDDYEFRGLEGLTVRTGNHKPQKVIIHAPDGKDHKAEMMGPDENGAYYASISCRKLPSIDWTALAREFAIKLPEEIAPKIIEREREVGL